MSSKDERKKKKSSSSSHSKSVKKDDKEKKPHRSHTKKDDKEKSSSSSSTKLQKKLDASLAEIESLKAAHAAELAKVKKSWEAKVAAAATAAPSSGGAADETVEEETDEITFEPKTGKSVKINAEWKGKSAGGTLDTMTWRYNPQIFFTVARSTSVKISVHQPAGSKIAMGWYLFEAKTENPKRFLIGDDDDLVAKAKFAKAQVVSGTFELKKGRYPYVLIPCTYDPGEETKFHVSFEASAEVTARLISSEQEWPKSIQSEWKGESAGGCPNFDSFVKNPQYKFTVTKQTQMDILLLQTEYEEFDPVSFYVLKIDKDVTQKITDKSYAKGDNVIVPASFSDPQQAVASKNFSPGSYAIIPTTFNPGQEAPFEITFLAEDGLGPVTELNDAAVIAIDGTWEEGNAGGCMNDIRKWRDNEQYLFTVKQKSTLTIKLKQTSNLDNLSSLGFYILSGGKRIVRVAKKLIVHKSKFVESKNGLTEEVTLPGSSVPYLLVPVTYDADVYCDFKLSILSSDPKFTDYVTLENLPDELQSHKLIGEGEWEGDTAGGCLNFATWRNNPQFKLDVGAKTEVTIFLTCVETVKEDLTPGFYIVNAPTNMELCVDLTPEKIKTKCAFRETREVVKSYKFKPGVYNIIPCTYHLGQESAFEIQVWTTQLGSVSLSPIRTGLLSISGSWSETSAGGCINDVSSWLKNPRIYAAVKQHTEAAIVMIQSPEEKEYDINAMKNIGFYITNSDGDGAPKTNEAADLISMADFSPDKDVVSVLTLPACHWPYVITPCTFEAGITGKFSLFLLTDYDNLENVELSDENIIIDEKEVLGADESPAIREIKRRYKPLAAQCVELVKVTEGTKDIPEFQKWIGRHLLQTVSQFADGIAAWIDETEPQYWTDFYAGEEEEEYDEEEYDEEDDAGIPPPPDGAPAPPPPPPPVNFSKPPKLGMITSTIQSNITPEQLAALESKQKNETSFVDEMLSAIKGGLAGLKKAKPAPPKPKVENPLEVAFNMTVLMSRRAAIEGLNDDEDDEDNWSDEDDW
eukprot:TRINITY_DN5316_c0_g1_i1.p1 TRINITY_DN5316_c0_g1~~TRINITY_DN5316_c0_g1_i1.p1  ORF type:complete len:1053 (+),score=344.21 TRINITY_DN5316_c0_g1_i1:69-3161(+)